MTILDQNLTWELEIVQRKKEWRSKEAQLRAERQKMEEETEDGESST